MLHAQQRTLSIASIKIVLGQFQDYDIIQHCESCLRPCCKLTDVVLDFDWQHFHRLYQITQTHKAFDRSLRDGSGPVYVRKQDGLYYTHGSPCPAYDHTTRRCGVYQSPLKPDNCSDFPVYLDEQTIVADIRCEALVVDDLLAKLVTAFPQLVFKLRHHPDFPVLHYIDFTPCASQVI